MVALVLRGSALRGSAVRSTAGKPLPRSERSSPGCSQGKPRKALATVASILLGGKRLSAPSTACCWSCCALACRSLKLFFFLQRKRLDFLSAHPHWQHKEQEACKTSQNSPVELGTEQACNTVESGLWMLQPSLLGCSIPRSLLPAALGAGPPAQGARFGEV